MGQAGEIYFPPRCRHLDTTRHEYTFIFMGASSGPVSTVGIFISKAALTPVSHRKRGTPIVNAGWQSSRWLKAAGAKPHQFTLQRS
jgi:hypothetical protein